MCRCLLNQLFLCIIEKENEPLCCVSNQKYMFRDVIHCLVPRSMSLFTSFDTSSPIFKTPVSDMSAYLDCFTREGNLSAVPCFTLDPLPHHTLNLIDSSGNWPESFEDLSPQLSNQSSVNCFSWYLFLARIHQSEWCNVCSSVLEILQLNHVKILRNKTVSNRNIKSLYNLSPFPQYVKIF